MITLSKQEIELSRHEPKDVAQSINSYLISLSANSSPGNEGFVSGRVDIDKDEFLIDPPMSTINLSALKLFMYGQFSSNTLLISFKTPILSFIYPTIAYIFLTWLFISTGWSQIKLITLPVLLIVLLVNILMARKQYKKDVQRHLNFINQILQR